MFKQSVNISLAHKLRTTSHPSPIVRLPIQRNFRRPRKDNGILTLNPGRKPYTLLFDGDKLPLQAGALQVVNVESVDEVSRFLMLLGDACEIFISPDFRINNPGVYALLKSLSYPSLKGAPPFDIETAAALMKKLPLDLKSLVKSPLALTLEDSAPKTIEKKFVHKKNDANVLISESFDSGRLHHFNMLEETEELSFDHTSDHVQGMLMLEALRQAAIATAHLQGLSFDGGLGLLKYNTNFFHYLESGAPIILRAYCSFSADETSEDKEAPIYIQVIQWGKVCAEATLNAFAYMSSKRYEQQRERIEKISSRSQMQFKAKVSKFVEEDATK
jgi:2-oxo-3-(phosphooxy)propyl 3-oxoalkanoate synthase